MSFRLNDLLAFKIHESAALIRKKGLLILKPFDIAPEQYGIMKLLDEGNIVNVSEIANLTDKDKSTITRMVNAIEKKGFITKETDKTDKRVQRIKLTKLGQSTVENVSEVISKNIDDINVSVSDEEYDIFMKIFDKILVDLRKGCICEK